MYQHFALDFSNLKLFIILTSICFHLLSQAETQLLIPENDAVPSPPEEHLGLDTQPNAKTAFLLSIDELLNAVSSFSFWF